MELAATILTVIVLLIHVYVVVIEAVIFRTRGAKVFRVPADRVEELAPIMSNQGCYNLFLVAALALGLLYPVQPIADAFTIYGLVCVVVAGVWGAVSVMPTIFFVQALPAILALAAFLMSQQ